MRTHDAEAVACLMASERVSDTVSDGASDPISRKPKFQSQGSLHIMKLSIATAVACALASVAIADQSQATATNVPSKGVGAGVRPAIKKTIDIPAQSLAPALQTLSEERDIHVVFITEDVTKLSTKGAQGELTVDETLTVLLQGTGLTYRYIDDKTVTVVPVSEAKTSYHGSDKGLRLAQNEGTTNPPTDKEEEDKTKIQEIVVTAQKKEERLQDVPVPVTAISGDLLTSSNQLQLQDYYTRVPGLSFTTGGRGEASIAIRGITTGTSINPTVGIVVDDAPFGSSTQLGGGMFTPDLDPSDLSRVEVLRGPQGTLYGASSIGGLLKFVTVDPSTANLSGSVQAGVTSVSHSDDVGQNLRGAINLPLSDTWAIRASGFYRSESGYVDIPAFVGDASNGKKDVNSSDSKGGRLAALWHPTQDFSLKLSALIQDIGSDGGSYVNANPTSGLQQSALRDTGWYKKKFQAYSANLAAKIGNVDVTSISAYNVAKGSSSIDFSFLGALMQPLFGVTGAPLVDDFETKKLTQEIRLSAAVGNRMEWLAGAFYTHEDSDWTQYLFAADPTSGDVVGTGFTIPWPTKFKEYAAFGNLTFHLTERFDLQVGARESKNRQSYSESGTGPLIAPFFGVPSYALPEVHLNDNSFTYLVTPSFKVSPDLMVYARVASGYRPGGFNQEAAMFNRPLTYQPDKTSNYEIGIKGSVLDHSLSFDASVYYIDWKDIQILVLNPSIGGYISNPGRAKSQGVELTVESSPLRGLSISGWVALGDAKLKDDFPPSNVVGEAGDRLPFSSRFSGSVSLDQEFPLAGTLTGFVGGSFSYVDNRAGDFSAGPRQMFGAYTKTDLRAGMRYDQWTINLFANNITDKRGALKGDPRLGFIEYIPPRAVGVSIAKEF